MNTVVEADNGSYYFQDIAPTEYPVCLTMDVKCRRCHVCLRRRAASWRIRAEAEILAAPRTWFGTMTLSPEAHLRMSYRAEARGVAMLNLSPSERFTEEHNECTRELTLWAKRIRKESGAMLRYCLVAEAHKSGLPHYHVLVHEVQGSEMVKERTLRLQWKLGHSKFKLVHDKRAAAYVCKYLSKSMNAKVRASIDYGKNALAIV